MSLRPWVLVWSSRIELELRGVLVFSALPVLLGDGVIGGFRGVEDGKGRVGHLLPFIGWRALGLGYLKTLGGQGGGIVTSLSVAGLGALLLLDEHREEDGLHVVGIDLQQAIGGAENLVRLTEP